MRKSELWVLAIAGLAMLDWNLPPIGIMGKGEGKPDWLVIDSPAALHGKNLDHAAYPGCDRRQTGCHRLKQCERHALRQGGKDEDVADRQDVLYVLAVAEEAQVRRDPESRGMSFELIAESSLPDDQEHRLRKASEDRWCRVGIPRQAGHVEGVIGTIHNTPQV